MKDYLYFLFAITAAIAMLFIAVGLILSFLTWSFDPFIQAYENLSYVPGKIWRVIIVVFMALALVFHSLFTRE